MISAVAADQAAATILLVIGVLLILACAIALLDAFATDSRKGGGIKGAIAGRARKNMVLFSAPLALLFIFFSAIQFIG